MFEKLTEENFILYAAKHYENPQCCDTDEFLDDLKRFKYLKRLFGKYVDSGSLNERLVLNHLVILFNVFGDGTMRMLFYKLDGFYPYLKPFLILMNRLPEVVEDSTGTFIHSSSIMMDQHIINSLRKI